MAPASRTVLGTLGAIFGLVGVLALLAQAAVRLAPLAIDPIREQMFSWWHWVLWVGWVVIQAYVEGYRGFQRSFSPRLVARALHIVSNPRWQFVVFAPLFCLSFFHATRRRLVFQWVFVCALVCVIVAVQLLEQPWRGLVDAGVVVGLGWGMIAIVVYFVRALAGHELPAPADLPHSHGA